MRKERTENTQINTDSTVPDHVIHSLARFLLPKILAFYESEEGQRLYSEQQPQPERSAN